MLNFRSHTGVYEVITHNVYNWYSKNSYQRGLIWGCRMKYTSVFSKVWDYEKVTIKFLMGEGHFTVIWEKSKEKAWMWQLLPEGFHMRLHNCSQFRGCCMGSAHTFHASSSTCQTDFPAGNNCSVSTAWSRARAWEQHIRRDNPPWNEASPSQGRVGRGLQQQQPLGLNTNSPAPLTTTQQNSINKCTAIYRHR